MSNVREQNSSAIHDAPDLNQGPVESDDEVEQYCSVDEILNHRFDEYHVLEYLVKWQGYDDPNDCTWEPEDHLENVQEELVAYHTRCGYVPGFGEDQKRPKRKARGRPRIKHEDQCFTGKIRSKTRSSVPAKPRERLNGPAVLRILPRTGTRPVISAPTNSPPPRWSDGSWEHLIARIGAVVSDRDSIDSATNRRSTTGWMANVKWHDGHASSHDIQTLHEHCPRLMCDWYGRHLYLADGEKYPSLSQDQVSRHARLVDGIWRV